MSPASLAWSEWNAVDGVSGQRFGSSEIEVCSPQALVQAIGYAKKALSSDDLVYFRGQTSGRCSMIPSLFRGIRRQQDLNKIIYKLNLYISQLRKSKIFMGGVESRVHEGLLQHYGVKTRYLDLVDNIWTALWFSCNKLMIYGERGQFYFFNKSELDYSYVYVMKFGKILNMPSRGVYETDSGYEVIDLRYAVQSAYVRPHMQHGVVVRNVNDDKLTGLNFFDAVEVVLKIKTEDALRWLGDSYLTSAQFMFPSPVHDLGYRHFLEMKNQPPERLGAVGLLCY